MTRAARLTTTRATSRGGAITIGAAYIAPPARLGSQAERIQHLLLMRPRPPGAADYLAAALALLVLRAQTAWRDSDLCALIRRHRRLGYSRRQSIARAIRCWLPCMN